MQHQVDRVVVCSSALRECPSAIHQSLAAISKLKALTFSTIACFILLLCGLFVLPQIAFAQEFRATVSGTVTDATGAVVPGGQVQVQEESTGTINRTVSDAAGQYVVPFLLPGNYSITVTATGFQILRSEEHTS